MSTPDNSQLLAAAQDVVVHLGFGVLCVGAVRVLRDACDKAIAEDEKHTRALTDAILEAVFQPKSETSDAD